MEAIRKLGGTVTYDWEKPALGKTEPPGPAWLRSLLGEDFFAVVVQVSLPPEVNDGDLDYLKGLAQLRELYLIRTRVTDAGLARLEGLTELRQLHLDGTKVTDEGVKKLQQALPNCRITR